MKEEITIKCLALLLFTVVPSVFAYNLLTSRNECDSAVLAYADVIRIQNSTSPDAKAREASMNTSCTAAGKQAEVLIKILPK